MSLYETDSLLEVLEITIKYLLALPAIYFIITPEDKAAM